MYIDSVEMNGFRGLNTTVHMSHPFSLIVGENNSGKSSVMDAIRLVIGGSEANDPNRLYVRETDFSFDDAGEYIEPRTFTIHLNLRGLSNKQRGRFITCLTPSQGKDCARLSLEASWDGVTKPQAYITGGEHGNREIEFFAREAIKCIYLPALRDATRDLRPGPSNRLRQLINYYAHPKGPDRDKIVEAMKDANSTLTQIDAIQQANSAVTRRLGGITGSRAFQQKAEVKFSDPTYDRVVGNLRALMGSSTPMELETNGLGFNNILYMSVLLAAIQDIDDSSLDVLLIEEPEAHLHPQLQELLAAHLAREAGSKIQVISTTHSPHFASSSPIECITVMSRSAADRPQSVALNSLPLEEEKLRYLRRFLDVTKASLFFAKGVILVEGIAEQLLMPTFAKICGRNLDEAGVSVINVAGLNFSSFVSLFGRESLPIKCAVVTDSDRTWTKSDEETDLSGDVEAANESVLIAKNSAYARRAVKDFENDYVHVFLATDTLEKDITSPLNEDQKSILIKALRSVRPILAKRLEDDNPVGDAWVTQFYSAVESKKGDFAQSLADVLDESDEKATHTFTVPDYLRNAIEWACGAEEGVQMDGQQKASSSHGSFAINPEFEGAGRVAHDDLGGRL